MLIKDVVNIVTLRPQELVFDFKRKVAGSVKECPMKYYRGNNPAFNNPSWGGWVENTDQISHINSVKYPDNVTFKYYPNTLNSYAQLMTELNLNFIPNFDKTKVKSITVDVWARGSGSNAGVLTNGVQCQLWNGSAWSMSADTTYFSNTTGNIAKVGGVVTTPSLITNRIDANKKLFILLHSNYPSDGTIGSLVELDYIRITIKLN